MFLSKLFKKKKMVKGSTQIFRVVSKPYITPDTECIELESENGFLVGSTNTKTLVEVEFNAHTDDYETKDIGFDNISFE